MTRGLLLSESYWKSKAICLILSKLHRAELNAQKGLKFSVALRESLLFNVFLNVLLKTCWVDSPKVHFKK